MPQHESTKPLTADEQKFVRFFERENFCHEKIPVAERYARLGKGEGRKMLRYKHVAQEVERRTRLLELTQVAIDARDQTAQARAEEKRVKVTLDLAEKALHKILQLDAKEHGSIKLAGIQTALVYAGAIKNNRMERIAPAGPAPGESAAAGYYASIFEGMRATAPVAEPAELMPVVESPYAPLVLPPKYAENKKQEQQPNPPPTPPRKMKIG